MSRNPRFGRFAVDGERVPDSGLDAEAIERSAEDLVVVEAIDEEVVAAGFVGEHAIDDTLVEVGGAQAPDATDELNVVGVVHFAEVIEGAGCLGNGRRSSRHCAGC